MNINAEEAWLNRACVQLAELAPQLALVSASLDQATRRVLMYAHVRASDQAEQQVGTKHVLLGIYDEGENAGTRVLRALGYEAPIVQQALNEFQSQMENPRGSGGNDGFFTELLVSALARAWEQMAFEGYANGLSPAFLVLGLWREGDGAAGRALAQLGQSYAEAQAQVRIVSGLTSK
ncbi:MAG TPA: Clp protease N-terminal domain-containing protein [Ktedonobacterales bacterium]|nr:Clp protease N-terminal domain-containing protein [Ktedonobacterales bacterium]